MQIFPVSTESHLGDGPRIVVVEDDGGETLALYRAAVAGHAPCRAGRLAAAIIRSDSLNTPDQVAVGDVDRHPNATRVVLAIRRYRGPMAANVPWFALVRVSLGMPGAGRHEILLREIVTETGGPTEPLSPATHEQRLTFECA